MRAAVCWGSSQIEIMYRPPGAGLQPVVGYPFTRGRGSRASQLFRVSVYSTRQASSLLHMQANDEKWEKKVNAGSAF